jgi:3-isopropylmalate/(R)-2-methylmalate dehydratase small subunit
VETGDEVTIDFEKNVLTVPARNIEIAMIPVGPMADIVKAGGLFSYARQTGRISAG